MSNTNKNMRYELRQFTDSTHTEYIVRATSDDIEILQTYLDRPSVPNDVWYRLHVVDTESGEIASRK